MKKITLSAIALMAFAFTQAQDLKFGAKAGLNLANLTGDVEDTSMKPGFHVGGFVEIKFSDKLALQPELLYSLQGAKTEYNYSFGDMMSESSESKINLSYINIPVMLKFYPVEKLFLEAGPQVGFLVSAKSKDEYSITMDGTTTSGSEDVDVKDSFKSIDFGFNIGAGYEFTENLFANVRYNIGLSNIAEETEIDVEDIDFENLSANDFSVKNSVLSVSIGYKF